ncbi:hypothetical protein CU100_19470 [Phyllobacterium endophyticum]|uniref:Uncharacterized protein n=1 Tax=Phyllobacterium endophyticum TaxID=1149773 RepID=A0A2P7ANP8_9HYPH|nr:hypothetical protein CU100_19470 [Phyllobacterium endophyticum]
MNHPIYVNLTCHKTITNLSHFPQFNVNAWRHQMAPGGQHLNLAVSLFVLATLTMLAISVVALDIEIALPRG